MCVSTEIHTDLYDDFRALETKTGQRFSAYILSGKSNLSPYHESRLSLTVIKQIF